MKIILLTIIFLLPLSANAYSIFECLVFEGPVEIKKERVMVNPNNQSTLNLGTFNEISIRAHSIDEFVVIFAESAAFSLNTTGIESSSLAIYNRQDDNKTLMTICELDPSIEESP